ncbi:MAG TPA: hypothetical protein VML55_23790 [Planctomycetaceae bacterium]|nr:hypothetical protein [Planctomycetaceae bacterium]
MQRRRPPLSAILAVQAVCLVLLAASLAARLIQSEPAGSALSGGTPSVVPVERREAHRIEPLYDDPDVVSDEQLAAVLAKIRPEFSRDEMHPNYIEHALRTWGIEAEFDEPGVLSGAALRDFLLEHRRQAEVFGRDSRALLIERPGGVGVRWQQPYDPRVSAHHDHLLASLSEAGVPLDQPVFPPSGRRWAFNDVLQEAVRDFQVEDDETEWSAMAFALWFAPETTRFRSGDGRTITFDLLARRLMQSHKNVGVCHGTHRIYTLVVLWRLNEEFERSVLSETVRREVWEYLTRIRDLIVESQFDDGHWPGNWADGRRAVANAAGEPEHQPVIATGHHLEWLAIAPLELHPPREQIRKAAAWAIAATLGKRDEEIRRQYTFYSHIGNALALWRGTRPTEFRAKWQATHGGRPADPPPIPDELLPPTPQ